MSALAERLKAKYFGNAEHPYRTFEREVDRLLRPDMTLLDAGCGRTAPVLSRYRGKARRLIGVDLVPFSADLGGIELVNGDLGRLNLPDGCVDVVMSRAVIEHVERPVEAYREVSRVLRPGGHFVFLTANFWDYGSLIAMAVPNRFHPWIVSKVEGRAEHDVFPIHYRSNTRAAVNRHAASAGLEVVSFAYLGQYPSYFMFNGGLFFLGTLYEKLISSSRYLRFLRGWILVVLKKSGETSQSARMPLQASGADAARRDVEEVSQP